MRLLKLLFCYSVSTFHVLALTPNVQEYIFPSDDERLEPNPEVSTGIFDIDPKNNNNERSIWDGNIGTPGVDGEANPGGDAGGD